MLSRRLQGVRKQYGPIVTYYVATLFLTGESDDDFQPDFIEIEPDTEAFVDEALRTGRWFAENAEQATEEDHQLASRQYDVLLPWIAKQIHTWLKSKPASPVAARMWADLGGAGARQAAWLADLAADRTNLRDWAHATHPNLLSMSIEDALKAAADWHQEMADKATDAVAVPGTTVYTFKDGWTVQRLSTPAALRSEADSQGICVGNSDYVNAVQRGDIEILSLRDEAGVPHVTIEVDKHRTTRGWHHVVQIKGRGNAQVTRAALCIRLDEAFRELDLGAMNNDWDACRAIPQLSSEVAIAARVKADQRRMAARGENPTFRGLPFRRVTRPGLKRGVTLYRFEHGGEPYLVELARARTPVPVPGGVSSAYTWRVLDAVAVSFYRERDHDTDRQYAILGSGGAVAILGTVIEVIKAFVAEQRPEAIGFTADMYEPTRVRLYRRMMSKIAIPGYAASVSNTGEAEQFFFVRADVARRAPTARAEAERRPNPGPATGEPTLEDRQAGGYCTDGWREWQQGGCHTYAHALKRLRPSLRFGELGVSDHGDGGVRGWTPTHTFVHDDRYAYDSCGRHPLPYHGIDGEADVVALDLEARDVEEFEEDTIDQAIAHAKRHRILAGTYGPHAASKKPRPRRR